MMSTGNRMKQEFRRIDASWQPSIEQIPTKSYAVRRFDSLHGEPVLQDVLSLITEEISFNYNYIGKEEWIDLTFESHASPETDKLTNIFQKANKLIPLKDLEIMVTNWKCHDTKEIFELIGVTAKIVTDYRKITISLYFQDLKCK